MHSRCSEKETGPKPNPPSSSGQEGKRQGKTTAQGQQAEEKRTSDGCPESKLKTMLTLHPTSTYSSSSSTSSYSFRRLLVHRLCHLRLGLLIPTPLLLIIILLLLILLTSSNSASSSS